MEALYAVARGLTVEILGVLPGCVGVPKVLIGVVKATDGDDKAPLSPFSMTLVDLDTNHDGFSQYSLIFA